MNSGKNGIQRGIAFHLAPLCNVQTEQMGTIGTVVRLSSHTHKSARAYYKVYIEKNTEDHRRNADRDTLMICKNEQFTRNMLARTGERKRNRRKR
ncbi:hypothetical protein [uncultured Bacteroides sp.]|uniref:hypothetical protein n=1 Tax=uncultured Bacteroides sp. TaxID=162156 RepID=UPI00261CA86D|nr:hypothetical protein [uncultured Bacteroides sp.]